MDPSDVQVLVSKDLSVESLQNYFASKPTPSRRELAELKVIVAFRRYGQPPGKRDIVMDEPPPRRSSWVDLYQ